MSGRVPVATTCCRAVPDAILRCLTCMRNFWISSVRSTYGTLDSRRQGSARNRPGNRRGVRGNRDNTEMLLKFRERSKTLIAFGTCACFGGIPGLRNLFTREELLRRGYVETESTVDE